MFRSAPARFFAALLVMGLAACDEILADLKPAPADPRRAAIEDLVVAHVDAGLFEGAILVAEGDAVIFKSAYGMADRTWNIKNTTDTRFHIGSVGKQLTGAIVMQLIEEGKLSLDDTLSELIADYPDVHGADVTLGHLLDHTSGIPNYTATPAFRTRSASPIARADLAALFADAPLEFSPGATFSYNNSGFFLAGVIIEAIEGKHYGEVLKERLLEPLGLDDMGYGYSDAVIPGYAESYVWNGAAYAPATPTHDTWILSSAMVYADVDDLFRWTRALFAGAPFKRPGSRDAVLELPEGKERNYAFGVGNVPLEFGGEAVRGVGHSGALDGYRSTQSVIVEKDWTVIILSNIGVDQNLLAERINRLLAGETVEAPKPPVSRKLGRLIAADGEAAAGAWFRRQREENPSAYDFDEGGLNDLGYALLAKGDFPAAILVFTLNTEAFPESANAYDSLGEAYRAAGRNALALASYEKSLAMDPSNANAEAAIAALKEQGL
ncbi:MAG: serine hydrolase [Pseudomonadota bacterium]